MSKENLINPFSDLISATDTNATSATNSSSSPLAASKSQINAFDQKVNALIEKVFLITVNKSPQKNKQLVYMEDIAPLVPSTQLNVSILEQALFERILLPTPRDFLLPNDVKTSETEAICETKAISYLYASYVRNDRCIVQNDSICKDTCKRIEELIVLNVATAIKQPALFEGQNFCSQLLDILQTAEDFPIKGQFLSNIVRDVLVDKDANDALALQQIVYPIFDEMKRRIQAASMITLDKWIVPVLMLFVSDKNNAQLAELLLDYATPKPDADGIVYADSILGHLLRLSILPKNQNGPYEYFENVMDAGVSSLSQSLWNYLKLHLDAMSELFKGFLLLGGDTRSKMMRWIGHCLHANTARGQIWNSHNPTAGMFGAMKTASDSFMIGLAGVLLRLCKPLLKPSLKVLMVDPSYCAVVAADREAKLVHMIDADKATCLVPTEENEIRLTAETYGFITECFFMTHRALDLSKYWNIYLATCM